MENNIKWRWRRTSFGVKTLVLTVDGIDIGWIRNVIVPTDIRSHWWWGVYDENGNEIVDGITESHNEAKESLLLVSKARKTTASLSVDDTVM